MTYAQLASTAAVFLALSSGALAAQHFLIRSTRQINPRVLSALRSRSGPGGPSGAPGAPGAHGPGGDAGLQGPPAPTPSTLAPKQTEVGVWGGGYTDIEGRDRYRLTASFPITLASPLGPASVQYVRHGDPPTPLCPGPGSAAVGILCLYESSRENVHQPSTGAVFDPEGAGAPIASVGRSGFAIELTAEHEDLSAISGTFAVTAPEPHGGGIIESLARGAGDRSRR